MSIEWSQAIAVGHPTIDAQHRELLHHFNELLKACRRQEGSLKLQSLLDFLADYTRTHFRAEEQLMEANGYPELEAHREAHRAFESKLRQLQEAMREKGPSLAVIVETNQALLKWIVSHIKNTDVAVGRFLENR